MLSGVCRFPAMESVVFGKPYAEALAQQVDWLDALAVFVLASGTLARTTNAVGRLRQVLGNRIAGVCAKIGAHTPRSDVGECGSQLPGPRAGGDLLVATASQTYIVTDIGSM
jgi:maleylacetate reductase